VMLAASRPGAQVLRMGTRPRSFAGRLTSPGNGSEAEISASRRTTAPRPQPPLSKPATQLPPVSRADRLPNAAASTSNMEEDAQHCVAEASAAGEDRNGMGAGPPTFGSSQRTPPTKPVLWVSPVAGGTTACICSLRVFCMKASSSSLVSTLCMCSSGCLQAHQPGKHVLHQRCAPVAGQGLHPLPR